MSALRSSCRRGAATGIVALLLTAAATTTAEAAWLANQMCVQMNMWKSAGALSYSYTQDPNRNYGNTRNFTIIIVDHDSFKIMDWQGYFLTSNGTSLVPTADWRGANSTWQWSALWSGNGILRNVDHGWIVSNAGAFLDALGATFLRTAHEMFPRRFASMEAGGCAHFNVPAAEGFTWTQNSPTPELNLMRAPDVAKPAWIQIHWGDGEFDVVDDFAAKASRAKSLGAASPPPFPSKFTNTPIVPNWDTCVFGLVGETSGCVITSRHVYKNPGKYTARVYLGSDWPSIRGVYVEIPITVKPARGTMNVLSIGDSFASGEGGPTRLSSPNTDPVTWGARQTLGLALDNPVWEERFHSDKPYEPYLNDQGVGPGSIVLPSDAHRSYYAGPAQATTMLQQQRPDISVRLQHMAVSGATVGAGSTTITKQVTESGLVKQVDVNYPPDEGPPSTAMPNLNSLVGQVRRVQDLETEPYDVVLINGGGNDINLAGFVLTDCALNLSTPCSIGQDRRDLLAALPGYYDSLKDQIRKKDSVTEFARVIATGLPPDFFHPALSSVGCVFRSGLAAIDGIAFETSEMEAINTLARAVNAVIRRKASEFGWTFVPVDYSNHGICAPTGERWLNTALDSFFVQADKFTPIYDTSGPSFKGAFHPNYGGFAHYAERILPHLLLAADAKFDAQPPTFSAIPDVVVAATGPGGAVVTYALPTATDLVDPNPRVACVPAPGSTFLLGDSVVSCTATDAKGNSTTGSFRVSVVDRTPPVIAPAPNIVTDQTGATGAIVAYATPSASDTISGIASVVCVPPSGSAFPVGTTAVTCTATDVAGNTATTAFSVTVRAASGNQPPICTDARPSVPLIVAPLHSLVPVSILGVTDPENDPVSIVITGVRQDEAVTGVMVGDFGPDAIGVGTSTVQLRSQRADAGNGRVYHVTFTASDSQGNSCSATRTVGVRKSFTAPIDGGPLFDSTTN